MLKKVQMRGGARVRRARRTLCTLSAQPRAPTTQMGLFQHPAGRLLTKGSSAPPAPSAARTTHGRYASREHRLASWQFPRYRLSRMIPRARSRSPALVCRLAIAAQRPGKMARSAPDPRRDRSSRSPVRFAQPAQLPHHFTRTRSEGPAAESVLWRRLLAAGRCRGWVATASEQRQELCERTEAVVGLGEVLVQRARARNDRA